VGVCIKSHEQYEQRTELESLGDWQHWQFHLYLYLDTLRDMHVILHDSIRSFPLTAIMVLAMVIRKHVTEYSRSSHTMRITPFHDIASSPVLSPLAGIHKNHVSIEYVSA
jgi:hypothetical protein